MDLDREHAWQDAIEAAARPPFTLACSHVLEAASTETDFLVPGMIPAEQISLIIGARGAAKSWLAYDLAIKTARGSEWLGRPCKQGNVLVLSYDNPPRECGRRFKRLGLKADDPVRFHIPDGPMYLRIGCKDETTGFAHADLLRGIVQKTRPILVLVDSFRQAHTLDENSAQDMGSVMGVFKQWVSLGAAVVIVHHAALSSEGAVRSRGSGEIEGSADAVIAVAAGGTASWTKTRSWKARGKELDRVKFDVIDPTDITTEVRLEDPLAGVDPAMIEAVRQVLVTRPEAQVREIRETISGRAHTLGEIARAIREGRV